MRSKLVASLMASFLRFIQSSRFPIRLRIQRAGRRPVLDIFIRGAPARVAVALAIPVLFIFALLKTKAGVRLECPVTLVDGDHLADDVLGELGLVQQLVEAIQTAH